MPALRILIADDHELVRQGLRVLLASRPAWEVCGEAADGREAVEKAAALQPDIILLDVSMPRLGGLEAAAIIRRESPGSEILIVSQHDPAQMAASALEAGARGFVSKSEIDRTLLSAIDSIVARARGPATSADAAAPVREARRSAADGAGRERLAAAAPSANTTRERMEHLLIEQNRLLELIARGRPLDECLQAIAESVTRLQPGVRAGVVIADEGRTRIERVVA